jgi:hypothetical protein
MSGRANILIVLKDASSHMDYNRRILEYLNDRHTAINDNMFTISIDVVTNDNINDYVRAGIESIPALQMADSEEYIYGVNSILAGLARLEIKSASVSHKIGPEPDHDTDSHSNAFYEMALKEMKCDDQEDPDAPSTLRAYHQDTPEAPLNDKSIEEKTKAYTRIYEDRRKRCTGKSGKSGPIKPPPVGPGRVDVDRFIQSGGFDKGEELLMRQIAQNL